MKGPKTARGKRTITIDDDLIALLMAERERYLACELRGRRFDIGLKYGLLTAQLALALSSPARADVLAALVELLAQDSQ